jgi:hypothetical protein
MKVVGEFNNVSKRLRDELAPKLKQGERKTFQMLNGVKDLHPKSGQETNVYAMLYPKTTLPSKDRIYDPYYTPKGWKHGEEVGGYVDIGMVRTVEKGEPKKFEFFRPGIGPNLFLGKFTLKQGNVIEEDWYEFLCLSNFNAKNPYRDKSIDPLFEPIDVLAESKDKKKILDDRRDALNIASDMDATEAREIADSFNWPYISEPEIVKQKVYDYADKHPTEFLTAFKNPATRIMAAMKKAVDANIIKIYPLKKQVLWAADDSIIATLVYDSPDEWLKTFVDFLTTSKNGGKIQAAIKQKLKAPETEPAA